MKNIFTLLEFPETLFINFSTHSQIMKQKNKNNLEKLIKKLI
jgi:hypothetical protein